MTGELSNVQIQVYLLKESIREPDEAVRDMAPPVIRRPLPDPLKGILLTKRSISHKPAWAPFLEEGIGKDLEELYTASASALVIVEAHGRFFALTYGYARSMLDPSSIEHRFGLKVALNSIDPEQMRAVDSRTVEEMTFHTRRQASRTSEISSFGLDTSRDLLRGVTGIPRDELVGSRISGTDSVTLSAKLTLANLSEKCGQLLDLHKGHQYRDRFAWIDQMQLVSDPQVKEILEEQLSVYLTMGDTDNMHLAPPEALDWQNISGFYYWEPRKSNKYEDLDVNDALAELQGHARGPISSDYLRKHHLWVEFRENQPVAKFTIYSSLVFEVEVETHLYVLSDGDWHEVDLDWANQVREQVSNIREAILALPPALSGEIEKEYNERAADALGAILLDRCLVRYGPARDPIELCDILTTDRKLIHVKRKPQSSTLSHLFMQGQNSALLLAREHAFRAEILRVAGEADLELEALIPLETITPSDYCVVFAIIGKRSQEGPHALPFFSQLSLISACKNLAGMGYDVSLAFIPLVGT